MCDKTVSKDPGAVDTDNPQWTPGVFAAMRFVA